jgi:hypothetical protein
MKVKGKGMSLLFDITTKEKAYEFLTEFLNIERYIIEEFIFKNPNDYNIEDFISYLEPTNNIKLKDININDLEMVVMHITTNDDNCKSINKYGLMNLQQSLTLNTPLRKYLDGFGFEFDFYNKVFFIDGKESYIIEDGKLYIFNGEYLSYDFEFDKEEARLLYMKFYDDHQINGFLYIDDYTGYAEIDSYPEILENLSRFCYNRKLKDSWVNNKENKTYVIKFKSHIKYFDWITFYKERADYLKDRENKIKLKKWIIDKALYRIHSNYFQQSSDSKLFAQMKREVLIPECQFLNIILIDKE